MAYFRKCAHLTDPSVPVNYIVEFYTNFNSGEYSFYVLKYMVSMGVGGGGEGIAQLIFIFL